MKNFRPFRSGKFQVFLKKEVGHFSRNLWPWICKKSQKISKFLKNFFFARNDPKCLIIGSQHHLCSPRQISGQYLSKKKLVIFQEIRDPDMQKKSNNFQFLKKIFSLAKTLNALKFVRNTISHQHHRPVFLKKEVGHFSRNLWPPDMQKKSKNFKFLKIFFFARNEPKRLIIRSQHHLCSPRQISGRYFAKK